MAEEPKKLAEIRLSRESAHEFIDAMFDHLEEEAGEITPRKRRITVLPVAGRIGWAAHKKTKTVNNPHTSVKLTGVGAPSEREDLDIGPFDILKTPLVVAFLSESAQITEQEKKKDGP